MALEDEIEKAKKELKQKESGKAKPKPKELDVPEPPSTNAAMLFFQWFTGKPKK